LAKDAMRAKDLALAKAFMSLVEPYSESEAARDAGRPFGLRGNDYLPNVASLLAWAAVMAKAPVVQAPDATRVVRFIKRVNVARGPSIAGGETTYQVGDVAGFSPRMSVSARIKRFCRDITADGRKAHYSARRVWVPAIMRAMVTAGPAGDSSFTSRAPCRHLQLEDTRRTT
jgi:hypothetical protein